MSACDILIATLAGAFGGWAMNVIAYYWATGEWMFWPPRDR